MSEFIDVVREIADGELNGVSGGVIIAMGVVFVLLVLVSIFAMGVSIYLAISYVRYNKKFNSCGKTGEEIARTILDRYGLQHIKVTASGSVLFGNSYSHFFKKVRLRRMTWQKQSVTALAMASQKSSLAILDKEEDPDMKTRIRLTPLIYFGPIAFVPMVFIGVLLDLFIFTSSDGICTIALTVLGLAIYVLSFVMSILVLKTEKKAQDRALEVMELEGLATGEELEMCQKLFRLYNIEYINDMIVALLELIYRVLQIVMAAQRSSSSSND